MKVKVLVLGCTRNIGIATIRALASSGYEVIGADSRPMPFRLHSRYADKYFSYEAETAEEEYEEIEKLVRKHQPAVLIPTIGHFTEVLARRIPDISCHTKILSPDLESYQKLTDKVWIYEICARLGVPAPRQLSVRQAREILSKGTDGTLEPTVVIKPREDIGAGRGVEMINCAESVVPVLERVARAHGSSFISEFVPGPLEDVVAVQLLFDRESSLVDYFVFEKLRLWPPKTGVTAIGRSIFARDLVERLLPIFRALHWRGPAEAEFKIDTTTGEAKLLEINGRFSGALAFAIACGVNFPKLVCDAALGINSQSDLSPHYPEGIIYWNPRLFAKSVWKDWRTSGYRWNTVTRALSQAAGKRVGSPWRLDDPAPIVGKVLIELKETITNGQSR